MILKMILPMVLAKIKEEYGKVRDYKPTFKASARIEMIVNSLASMLFTAFDINSEEYEKIAMMIAKIVMARVDSQLDDTKAEILNDEIEHLAHSLIRG